MVFELSNAAAAVEDATLADPGDDHSSKLFQTRLTI